MATPFNAPTPVEQSPLAGTIPEEHVRLRQQVRAFALHEAEPWHRAHLTRLYQVWEDANAAYYGGALVVPLIQLLEPITPRAYGDCSPFSGIGSRSQIRLRPSLLQGHIPICGAARITRRAGFCSSPTC